MQKSIFNSAVSALIFISFVLLTSFKTFDIILQDEPIPFKPAGFYIAAVNDERAVKGPVAQLVVKDAQNKTVTQTADLQGGASAAIGRFIAHNLATDKSLTPVIISIKEFKLTETPLANGSVDGHIKLLLSFGIQKDYGVDSLINYNGGLHYIRPGGGHTGVIELQLRSILKDGLTYFNGWMNTNINASRKLAKGVCINFTDYTGQTEGDTIYYAAGRPLMWADFQSRVKPSVDLEAEVMPGFGYEQQAEVINGIINVHLTMKTFVPKSACWAGYTGRSDYALNHEQRHFDIAKIIAEQFKQKILAAKLTPDTFEAFINMQYLDSYRDMHAMQKAYDNDTSHGRNESEQFAWNSRIDKELKAFN